jgi:hypothetical protein
VRELVPVPLCDPVRVCVDVPEGERDAVMAAVREAVRVALLVAVSVLDADDEMELVLDCVAVAVGDAVPDLLAVRVGDAVAAAVSERDAVDV